MLGLPPPSAQVVDTVVARVDSVIITQSELVAEARLALLRRTSDPERALGTAINSALGAAILQSLVHRQLLLQEIGRLQLKSVPEEEVISAVSNIRRRFPDTPQFIRFLEAIGISDPADALLPRFQAPGGLVSALRAELEAARFVGARIRVGARISDEEVRACFEARSARFAGRSLPQVSAMIRQQLKKQREETALNELLDQLEVRADIWIAPPYRNVLNTKATSPEGFTCPERTS